MCERDLEKVYFSHFGLVLGLSQFQTMTEQPQKCWSCQKGSKVTKNNLLKTVTKA